MQRINLDDEFYVTVFDREYTLHRIVKVDKDRFKKAKNDTREDIVGYFGTLSGAIERWLEYSVNGRDDENSLLDYVKKFESRINSLACNLEHMILSKMKEVLINNEI